MKHLISKDLSYDGNRKLALMFYRFLPMVAIAEVKTVMPQAYISSHRTKFDYQPSEDTPVELRRGQWFT